MTTLSNALAGCQVAVVGAGSIGVAFSVVFARAGGSVRLHDPDAGRLAESLEDLGVALRDLHEHGLLAEDPAIVARRVRPCAALEEAVAGAVLVQECAPERLDLKRELFQRLERAASCDVIFASASSAIMASETSSQLASRDRCLVAHPGNPPYLIPVIELVPAAFTSASVVEKARALYAAAGMQPVVLRKEIEGFLFNRLQGAVLREAYCLVRDGVADVEDIDAVMRDGLGLRWCFIGPFETVDLNTRGGVGSHATKMGPAYLRMGMQRGQNDPWTPELVAKVESQRRAKLPLDEWKPRGRWRDRVLMQLVRARGRALENAGGSAGGHPGQHAGA